MRNVIICILLLLNLCIFHIYGGEATKFTINSGGLEREYLVYLPKGYSSDRPAGLIICLHGFNRTVADFFSQYNVTDVADSLHLIIIAPQALPEQSASVIKKANELKSKYGVDIPLDAAWGCGLRVKAKFLFFTLLDEELNASVDDVTFINTIVNSTIENYHVNTDNQFIFGTSMGGFMSYQYALGYGNDLSGLISVCGSMGTEIKWQDAAVSLPICDFHSVDDEVVPYTGVMNESMGVDITLCKSKDSVLSFWKEKNKTMEIGLGENINYYPSENNKSVMKYTYIHPVNEVIHYKITNAYHDYYFKKENGDCMDYNEEICKFIINHSKSSGTGIFTPSVNDVLKIWPNPAKDIVNINASSGRAMLYDLSGKLHLSTRFEGENLNVSTLRPGTYLIRIITNEGKTMSGKLKIRM